MMNLIALLFGPIVAMEIAAIFIFKVFPHASPHIGGIVAGIVWIGSLALIANYQSTRK